MCFAAETDTVCVAPLNLRIGGVQTALNTPGIPLALGSVHSVFTDMVFNLIFTTASGREVRWTKSRGSEKMLTQSPVATECWGPDWSPAASTPCPVLFLLL